MTDAIKMMGFTASINPLAKADKVMTIDTATPIPVGHPALGIYDPPILGRHGQDAAARRDPDGRHDPQPLADGSVSARRRRAEQLSGKT
ncbi:MAG: hypothetical protein KDG89_14830 [Geminicoccaceae bacterium]|nr:hypothetical protein [Geminicoccaceae bacterium]